LAFRSYIYIIISPPKFTIYRKDRSSRGGGVLMAIDTTLPSRILPNTDDIEVVAADHEVQLNKPLKIVVLYHPLNSGPDLQRQILSYIYNLLQEDGYIVIMGDFNTPDVDWLTLSVSSEFSSKLCNLIFDYNLTQHAEHPIHVQGYILDLIISNLVYDDSIAASGIQLEKNLLLKFDLRQHYNNKVNPVKNSISSILDYSKADFESTNSYLSIVDFSPCQHSSDVEFVWSFI